MKFKYKLIFHDPCECYFNHNIHVRILMTLSSFQTKVIHELIRKTVFPRFRYVDFCTLLKCNSNSIFLSYWAGKLNFILQALAGERACYNTIKSFGNQVLFLGMRSFHVISTRSWLERLNNLLEQVCQILSLLYFLSLLSK